MKLEEIKEGNIWILRFLEDRFDSMSVSDFKEKISEGVESGNNKILLNLNVTTQTCKLSIGLAPSKI